MELEIVLFFTKLTRMKEDKHHTFSVPVIVGVKSSHTCFNCETHNVYEIMKCHGNGYE